MENTDNQNTQYHIAHTKLFKSSLPGASGNEKKVNIRGCEALKMLDFYTRKLLCDNKMTTF